jgi:ligand-binding SRPBCC domain-containing protein
MATIQITTLIHAPIERVFDLFRSIDAHQHSTSSTSEVAIGGITSGLISLGEEVEWEAYHFGVKQRLRSKITALNRPNHFQDVMLKGAFLYMKHDHYFREVGDYTELKDVFEYKAPLGVLGTIAEKLFLTRYMRKFLLTRNHVLKQVAESDEWNRFLVCRDTV